MTIVSGTDTTQNGVALNDDPPPVVSLGDWLLLMLVVIASTVAATFIVPAWQVSLRDTMSGDKPRVFWYLGRSGALVGFVWLWLSMILGLLMTNKLARAWAGGPSVYELHQFASLIGLLFGIFHAFVLMGSRFLHYDFLDVVIPFHSDSYRTLWVGLGQVGLHLMALVSLSIYVKRFITQRVWRAVHFLSFVSFALVIAHGMQTGSDSASPLVFGLYIVSAISVLALSIVRLSRGIGAARARRMADDAGSGGRDGAAASASAPAPAPQPPTAPARQRAGVAARAASSVAAPAESVHVIFGSQTGNAEALAQRTVKALAKADVIARAISGADFARKPPRDPGRLIVISSTTGDGEAPDNMQAFLALLRGAQAPKLAGHAFCVLALGDSSYEHFCQAGKDIDAQLARLGAHRAMPLTTCDADYETPYQQWQTQLLSSVAAAAKTSARPVMRAVRSGVRAPRVASARRAPPDAIAGPIKTKPRARKRAQPALAAAGAAAVLDETKFFVMPAAQPRDRGDGGKTRFAAPVLRNVNLTMDTDNSGAVRQIRQVVFSLLGSDLSYEPGDALSVLPENASETVSDVLRVTGLPDDAPVPLPDGGEAPLHVALARHYDIAQLTSDHIQAVAERTGSAVLRHWLKPENAATLKQMTEGRQLIDLLAGNRGAFDDARAFVATLRKLKPRLYSISSSQKAYPRQVHLTVGVVNYAAHGRQRQGVCSGDLARATTQTTRQISVHSQKSFRLPDDPRTPIIMVGPGTGIAPFRAFLQERAITGASGKNWLFFGCCNAHADFLYQDELHQLQTSGTLTRLDVAFSRDQQQKVYVQHLMREKADKLWRWFADGAHFYVCGDATRMAKDVDAALHDMAMRAGGLSEDSARDWVAQLRQQKRYQRDVY